MSHKHKIDTVHFHVAAIAATTPYVLVDLSDTTNFLHTETDGLGVLAVHITAFPSTTGNWSIHVGVITEVDASNGTADWFYGVTFSQILYVDTTRDFTLGGTNEGGLDCTIVAGAHPRWLTNDQQAGHVNWQTDTGLASPVGTAGGATGKPGAGDIVMLVTENSGTSTLSLDVTLEYLTH